MSEARQEVHTWPATMAAALIVLLAAALRLSGIHAGLPYRLTNDEPFVLGTAVRMMQTGDLNPHFFEYGGFTLYLHLLVGIVTFMQGAMAGAWTSVDQFWQGALAGPSRIVTALMGTATVGIVYSAAARIGRPLALVAALALAVHTVHVRESHFALPDVPLTFLLALAWLLSIRAAEHPHARTFGWAGMAVGLAAATKITGAVGIVMPLVALVGSPKGTPRGGLLAAIATGSAIGYIVAAPYTLLALPEFLNSFGNLAQTHRAPAGFGSAAWTYVEHLRNGFSWSGVLSPQVGWVALLVASVGAGSLVAGIRSRRGVAVQLPLLVFGGLYFCLIADQGSRLYGRYAVPLLPVLAVLLAAGLVTLGRRMVPAGRLGRAGSAALLLLVLAPTLASSIAWSRQNAELSTLDQAADWILRDVPPSEPLAVEAVLFLPPAYQWWSVTRITDRSPDAWRELGVRYLVASSAVSDVESPERLRARRDIERAGRLVQVFAPTADHPGPTVTVIRLDPELPARR